MLADGTVQLYCTYLKGDGNIEHEDRGGERVDHLHPSASLAFVTLP